MSKYLRPGLAASMIAFASPVFAGAPGDPPLDLIPVSQRLTLLKVLVDAKPVVQVVLAGLVLALGAALVLWLVQLIRSGKPRPSGASGALAFLSALASAGPLVGLFGAAYGLLDSFIGIANVRPTPTLTVLAPGFAEAALCVCLGLLAAAVAVIAQRHLKARLYAEDTRAPAAVPASPAGAAG